MDKDKTVNETCETAEVNKSEEVDIKDEGAQDNQENQENQKSSEATGQETEVSENSEIESLKASLEEKTKRCDEYKDMLQRLAAEFDNYKKRTAREKEALYFDALSDVVSEFLPVIDNIERAINACKSENSQESMLEGIELINRQVKETLKKLGVEQIDCVGKRFDPNLHEAVMHIEDDTYEQNVVVEEFQKGYIFKDKVIRHSIVKVAN
ncbi:MAG TPA: nucleotide exchange factor GrpE [Clostridiaceae bacterium]|nr:nucleotide exchange factor GrpE [Clostridiaceae bacterium]